MSGSVSYTNFGTEQIERFKACAEKYRDFAKEALIEVTPYREASLPLFSALGIAEQKQVIDALEVSLKIFDSVRVQGGMMTDSPALTWHALKEFGFRPPSDLFTRIHHESIIEIHAPNGMQIFRNFNFYRFCSYTLEELYCCRWDQLYARNDELTTFIGGLAKRVYMGEIRGTTHMDVPAHTVEELFSVKKYKVGLKMQWIAPLFQEGTQTPSATIVVETADFISRDLFDGPHVGSVSNLDQHRPVKLS